MVKKEITTIRNILNQMVMKILHMKNVWVQLSSSLREKSVHIRKGLTLTI